MRSFQEQSRILLVFFIFLCLFLSGDVSFFLWPLDPGRRVTQYARRIYTTFDGLPQNGIISIVQTRDGYLWFGTQDGAARFDGLTFTVFNRHLVKEMKNAFVHKLHEDPLGRLWICTREGVLKYENRRFTSYSSADGMLSNQVLAAAGSKDGTVWFGTVAGVNRLRDGNIETLDIFTRTRILSLYCSRDGTAWIGSVEGLARVKGNDSKIYTTADGLPEKIITAITEGPDGYTWLATEGGGIARFNGESFEIMGKKDGLTSDVIKDVRFDRDGNLWVCTADGGINRLHKKNGRWRIEVLDESSGLSSKHGSALCEDMEGNLWIGTRFGLNQLRDGKTVTWTSAEGLSGNFITPVFEDKKGRFWISCYPVGLNIMENGEIYDVPEFRRLSTKVMSLFEDHKGQMWAGTNGSGLIRFNYERRENAAPVFTYKQYTERDGLSRNNVWAITEDRRGNLWIGTKKGLCKMTGEEITVYGVADGMKSDYIYGVIADRQDIIWVGTVGGGLVRVKDGNFKVYTDRNGLSDNAVMCLYMDKNGILWFGTSRGLHRFDPVTESFTVYTTATGLSDDLVFQILEDRNGDFWLSSNKGISRVNKGELDKVAWGKRNHVHTKKFSIGEGVNFAECNGGFQPAGCISRNGRVFFPTSRGVVMVDPGNNVINHTIPPVYITGVIEDGRSVPVNSESLSLGPGLRKVVFDYTALSYTSPRDVSFKIMLEGFDKGWEYIESPSERSIYYHKLPPGDYTLRLQACNNDGVWNRKGTSLRFSVKPTLWEMLWVKIVAGILFALASYVAIGGIRQYMDIFRFWKKRAYIGKYRILEKIATGGMGTIYRASHTGNEQDDVALKVLREEYNTDDLQKKRFKQEGAIIDRIRHPHIINVIERGEHEGNMFIAMELLNGRNLGEILSQKQQLPVNYCVHIMKQVVDALREIHKLEIVHRDIKPENIMLIEKEGDPFYVKVLDFGLARDQSYTRLTQSGMLLGTISYLAPEQIKSNKFSASSDVYSLGVVCYEMLTGIKPFPGDSPLEVLGQILGTSPVEPRSLHSDVPQWLNLLVLAMMAKEPEERPTVDEVWDELTMMQ